MRRLHLSEEKDKTANSLLRKSLEAKHPRMRGCLLALALIAEELAELEQTVARPPRCAGLKSGICTAWTFAANGRASA